jgi:hypothetical protein
MERQFGHTRKIIEEDQLLYEGELARRARLRVVLGVLLLLVGLAFVCAAIAPLVVKESLPSLWVASAIANGWSKYLQHIGLSLLASGRIELFPLWVSYVALGCAAVVAWFGAQLIRNRHEPKLMGEVFTRRYWRHFYLFKEPGSEIKVSYQDPKKRD